jgi:hypothetical protein
MNFKRVVFSRELSDGEIGQIGLFVLAAIRGNDDIYDYYFYIYVDQDIDITITSYRSEEVQWQAKQLLCTDLDAVVSMVEYEGFYEDYMRLLWANEIGDLNRYVAQTKKTLTQNIDPVWCIAENEKDALYYFKNIINIKDVVTIREDNEETF